MEEELEFLWLCPDCNDVGNGDLDTFGYHFDGDEEDFNEVVEAIEQDLSELGLIEPWFGDEDETNFDEFNIHPCDCCGSYLPGPKYKWVKV